MLYIHRHYPFLITSRQKQLLFHMIADVSGKGNTVATVRFTDTNYFYGKIPRTLKTIDPVIWGRPAVGEHTENLSMTHKTPTERGLMA